MMVQLSRAALPAEKNLNEPLTVERLPGQFTNRFLALYCRESCLNEEALCSSKRSQKGELPLLLQFISVTSLGVTLFLERRVL